jgi:hypothetical protein
VILVVALITASVCVALAAGATPAQLTEEVRAFGLMIVAAGIAASLLAVYFDWRERLMRGLRAEHDAEDSLKTAA